MKLLLIAGHGGNDPGACSSYGIERDETRIVVNKLINEFKGYKNLSVDVYPMNRNAYSDVKNGTVQVNFANYDYVIEVHFNSASVSAKGVEVWVTKRESSISVEQRIVNNVAKIGLSNRGVKKEDFAVIYNVKSKGTSASLIEICFISNKEDMDLYRKNIDKICEGIVSGVAEGFSLTKEETKVPYNKRTGYLNVKPFMNNWSVYKSDKYWETWNRLTLLNCGDGLSFKILDNPRYAVYKVECLNGIGWCYAEDNGNTTVTDKASYKVSEPIKQDPLYDVYVDGVRVLHKCLGKWIPSEIEKHLNNKCSKVEITKAN